jgi:deoxyribodipyrimidine photo-lyase
MEGINTGRIRVLKKGISGKGPVVYWMSRDQRVHDNWALLYSVQLAEEYSKDLLIVFTLSPSFEGAGIRQYGFMLKGLLETAGELENYGINFRIIQGDPADQISLLVRNLKVSYLVTDFDPLRIKRIWKKNVCDSVDIPIAEVDSHNIVPCFHASNKQEFGAYTLRPKIHRLLNEYLVDFPEIMFSRSKVYQKSDIGPENLLNTIKCDKTVKEVEWIKPGFKKAMEQLELFLSGQLNGYSSGRNDPNINATSGLSPYLHFGQISAQRVALEIIKRYHRDANTDAFLEELIIRRELSDNYCFYNPDYDNIKGIPAWASKTLIEHRNDEREYLYSEEEFELARTHDPLWNAAQMQMVISGKMHGYMRMYWAKKILEWSSSAVEAYRTSLKLNDKYELDGRDPNGYAGCAWSIGGVHDRAWNERPVFGKIRYMSYDGCKRKFNVDEYIRKWTKG